MERNIVSEWETLSVHHLATLQILTDLHGLVVRREEELVDALALAVCPRAVAERRPLPALDVHTPLGNRVSRLRGVALVLQRHQPNLGKVFIS